MLFPLLLCVALADPQDQTRALLTLWLDDEAQVEPLMGEAAAQADATARALGGLGEPADTRARVWQAIADNLREKESLDLRLDADGVSRQVIGYEAFKLESYVRGGVFPKRYFGYLDLRGDTAAHEARLIRAVHASAVTLNAWQAERGHPTRVTEAELVVTFLAEGGAWFLGERQDLLEGLHPVFDVGLDNLASGLADEPELCARLDAAVGTDLAGLVAWTDGASPIRTSVPQNLRWLQHGNGDAGPFPYLTRSMTFEEAVVGTALMVVWEKEIAARKIRAEGWAALETRPADEQFIAMSLVYNSGLLFGPERWEQIRVFSTGDYLYERSEANARQRWRLNLLAPGALLAELAPDGDYRDQPTSWNAVYHVMQRYGAWAALHRFTALFDERDAFRVVPELPGALAPVEEASVLPAEVALPPRSGRGRLAALGLGLLAALGWWKGRSRG